MAQIPGGDTLKGHNLRVKIGGLAIAASETCSLDSSWSFEEISHKDTVEGFTDQKPTKQKWKITTKCYLTVLSDNTRTSHEACWDAHLTKTMVAVSFEDAVVGNSKFSGSGYISSAKIDSANEKSPMFDLTIEGTGQLTRTTNV
jgi:hypothetical protein